MKPLTSIWNLDFGTKPNRRANLRREIRGRLRAVAPGRGNRAWKRLARERAGVIDLGFCILYGPKTGSPAIGQPVGQRPRNAAE